MAPGRWNVNLQADTPVSLTDQLNLATSVGFASAIFTAAPLDPTMFDSADLLTLSVYTGIYRAQEERLKLDGPHATAWLADEDGKGDLIEAGLFSVGSPLSNWVTGLTTPALSVGTITDPGGSLGWNYSWTNDKANNPRAAMDAVCDWFTAVAGSTDDPVEWEVSEQLEVNAGLVSAVYGTTPSAIFTADDDGREHAELTSFPASMTLREDLEDYTDRVLASDTSATLADYPASAWGSTPYNDPQGADLHMARVVSGVEPSWSSLTSVAQGQYSRFKKVRQKIDASLSGFCPIADIRCGSYVWAWDPFENIYDTANEITFRGEVIRPLKLRVKEINQPLQAGMGVYIRYYDGSAWQVIDLTPWVEYESGETRVTIGDLAQTLGKALVQRGIR